MLVDGTEQGTDDADPKRGRPSCVPGRRLVACELGRALGGAGLDRFALALPEGPQPAFEGEVEQHDASVGGQARETTKIWRVVGATGDQTKSYADGRSAVLTMVGRACDPVRIAA